MLTGSLLFFVLSAPNYSSFSYVPYIIVFLSVSSKEQCHKIFSYIVFIFKNFTIFFQGFENISLQLLSIF